MEMGLSGNEWPPGYGISLLLGAAHPTLDWFGDV